MLETNMEKVWFSNWVIIISIDMKYIYSVNPKSEESQYKVSLREHLM